MKNLLVYVLKFSLLVVIGTSILLGGFALIGWFVEVVATNVPTWLIVVSGLVTTTFLLNNIDKL